MLTPPRGWAMTPRTRCRRAATTSLPVPKLYDCAKCPGYCCTYPVIEITRRDVNRLAAHHGISPDEAERRFTKSAHGCNRVLRRKKDALFGKVCRFFDTTARRCRVYAARPGVCRDFPGGSRCGYYDFLTFERRQQNDPEFVATTDSGVWD